MIPFLTYPLALLALASLPALTAIYLLRNRFRRRQVSSLMLWRFRVQSREGGSRLNRLQLPWLFFLELVALALLATAATGPYWKLPRATRPLVVVLDDSFSMRAVVDGVSTRTRARQALQKLFRFQAPPSTRLVLAGSEPRLLGAPARNGSEVDRLLDQWTCWSPTAALEGAITLASELGKQQANILVLTDHPPPDNHVTSPRLEWRAFGVPTGNTAIVNASRAANGEDDRCLIEVANLSASPRNARLLIHAGSNTLRQAVLALAPREQQRLVFNTPGTTPTLEARLDADALLEDNQVQLLPPVRKRVRVRVALTNSTWSDLVDRTLAATGLRSSISDDPELIIHHSDSAPGSNTWSLCWRVPRQLTAYTGPFIIDASHPLAEGLHLDGAVWAGGTNVSSGLPIVMAGNVPLLSVREDLVGRRYLTLNLDPELSTLTRTPDWPVLFWNLLEWRAAELPGLLESNARLGTDVILKTTGDPVTVREPDGTEKSFNRTGDQLALETPLPGVYSVTMGHSTNAFAVNVLAGEESDLQKCASGQWGRWQEDLDRRFEQRPLTWLFTLSALGLLTAHLWVVATGRGGGR